MQKIDESQIHSTIGDEGFARLVGAFYRRVKTDDLLGPLYPPDDFEAAELRLREFLIQRFGGPDRYSQSRGHPRLRMRHAPFKIDENARDRWVRLMEEALQEAKLPAEIDSMLRSYFHATATFMLNYSSP